jgi:elongation factor Ts
MTTEISAGLVKELRERTGVGMMECKKALVAANGDIEKAIEDLRKAGQAKAVKKSDRIAAEGLIVISIAKDAKSVAMVEINCETDFVAREEKFREFANAISSVALHSQLDKVEALADAIIPTTKKSVEETRLALVATLGENIAVRRAFYLQVKEGVVGAYLHGSNDGARIASIVAINKDEANLAKDLAMQVAAMKPEYIAEKDLPAERIAKEKEIFMAEVMKNNAGKPADILEKIVLGKLKKLAKEITLLGQEFVKDSDTTIEQLLKNAKAEVTHMVRYEVGEGIEKKANNFIEDVMSQVRG